MASSVFATARSAKPISSLLVGGIKATDCGLERDDDLYDRFLLFVTLALENDEVELGLKAWVDAWAVIWKRMHSRRRHDWQTKSEKLWGAFFKRPASNRIACPCLKQDANSLEDHFRLHHLPPVQIAAPKAPSAKHRSISRLKRSTDPKARA